MMLVIDKDQDGRLLISALQLFDEEGKIIATIENQVFWVSPNVRKKRPDLSTLIVYDQYNIETLRIEVDNPQFIRVQGAFHSPGWWSRSKIERVTFDVDGDVAITKPGDNVIFGNCLGNTRRGLTVRPGGAIQF